MTTNEPPRRFSRAGLAGSLGPEVVALTLSVVFGLGGLLVIVMGSTSGVAPNPSAPTASSTVPSASPSSAAAATTANPTATLPNTATPTTVIAPAATPTATPRISVRPQATPPSWQPAARTLIAADLRLIQYREELRAEVARRPARADALAQLIRTTNVGTLAARTSIQTLGASDAPTALVAALGDSNQAALDAGLRTLTNTIQNVKAYRDGASQIVAALEPLETQMRALAVAASLPDPLPGVSASPSAGPSASARAP